MERNLVFEHDGFVAVVREPERVYPEDLGLDLVKGMWNFKIRSERFEEYSSLGFPVWKRTKMEGIEIPPYTRRIDISLENLESVKDCELIHLIDEMDFEGSDRKYTLMVDVFHNGGFCSRFEGEGSAKVDLRLENLTLDENLLVVSEGSSLELVRYVHGSGTRVSNDRILLERNSRLVVYDILNLSEDSSNISNSFFELEEGSELELHQIAIGGKRNVLFSIFGVNGARVSVVPGIVQAGGVTDIMHVGRIKGPDSEVSVGGRGFVKSGRVIFRGVMDVKKGVVGSKASEKFRCVLLDERAEFETIPSLFVEEDRVTAEHGASSSPLSEDQIFYLMSRGLSEKEAIELVVEGYFQDVYERFEFGNELRNRVRSLIE